MSAFEVPVDGSPADLAAMREAKLRTLRFRRQPAPDRREGQPANFLTAEMIAEFAIPDAPPVSANQYGGPFIAEIRDNPDKLCVDVGAGLRPSCLANVVNTEIYASASTDVLCVGEDLPFESEQFDYALCCAVLEHTRRPWDVAREICRVLKPGGKVLVDYPFLQGVHGYPHHYFNATPRGAISLFEEHCDILESSIGRNNHPIQALCWVLDEWRRGLAGADAERFGQLTVSQLLRAPADAQVEADHCRLSEHALRAIPAGSTLIARKCHRPRTSSPVQSRLEALEIEIAALRASRSWRITAPLRAVRTRGRRAPVQAVAHTPAGDTDRDLVMRFESLGDNCEFGLMQRKVGVERLSLLRYGGARNTRRLVEAVRNGLAGFGTVEDLDMYTLGREWIALSLRYGFSFHTGRLVDAELPATIRQAVSTQLLFMADLLRQDIASGHKVFVRRVDEGDANAGMVELYRALRSQGQATLLWVVRATTARPHATIEHVRGELYLGYHGGFAAYDSAGAFRDDLWVALLRKAEAAITARRETRSSRSLGRLLKRPARSIL